MSLDEKLLRSLDGKRRELDKLRPFPKSALERLHHQFIIEWTFNSNAIEGNTLTLRETALVLNEGITISGKPLREHFEAINHQKAILTLEDFIGKKVPLDENLIKSLHKIILTNIDEIEAGCYRKERVRILGATHIPPDPLKISKLMAELIADYYQKEKVLHPIELAAEIHYQLVKIHPFLDGNGRTARLIMNLILMKAGYPPAVILKLDRKKYYHVLRERDNNKREAFDNFVAKSVERSLIIYLEALTPSTNKAYNKQGYLSLAEATKYCNYSQEYLSLLARTGKLAAVKINRNWLTTKEAVEEYQKLIFR